MGSTPTAPRVGDILADRYRLDRVVGRGGMGTVFAATHLELGERVAIKVLSPAAVEAAASVERLLLEAKTAFRLKSAHVARVLDVGRGSAGPFIVMELLEGETLHALIARSGALAVDVAVGFILQICDAMTEAHALGIVHRDLKPDNVFIATGPSREPVLKIVDFGIAKVLLERPAGERSLTGSFDILGTPQYMAPEQLRKTSRADLRCDVWSMGAILYRMLTNAYPIEGKTDLAVMGALVEGRAIKPPRMHDPDIPILLDAIVMRCLAWSPSDRYASAEELRDALVAFQKGGDLARTAELTAPNPSTPTIEAPPIQPGPPLWPLAAGALVLVAGVAIFTASKRAAPIEESHAAASTPTFTETPRAWEPAPTPPVAPVVSTSCAGAATTKAEVAERCRCTDDVCRDDPTDLAALRAQLEIRANGPKEVAEKKHVSVDVSVTNKDPARPLAFGLVHERFVSWVLVEVDKAQPVSVMKASCEGHERANGGTRYDLVWLGPGATTRFETEIATDRYRPFTRAATKTARAACLVGLPIPGPFGGDPTFGAALHPDTYRADIRLPFATNEAREAAGVVHTFTIAELRDR